LTSDKAPDADPWYRIGFIRDRFTPEFTQKENSMDTDAEMPMPGAEPEEHPGGQLP
jgi:hypothetical protein